MTTGSTDLQHVDAHLKRLLESRQFPKTICPSEVARALSQKELADNGVDSWRELMSAIREYVFLLRDKGEVEIVQRGIVLPASQTLHDTRGPIRVRSATVTGM
ncbi:hypothetical protein LTR05_008080 [Lithohypha guttulata]|uniref:DUF3253 domain-containing protein n=1 Tax=Lithohypha guttulata TaxID=1690604 RepID=A0AAN7STR4_9EURO|nr:hypothetical protein LTR05_008080 [Lithohypha guttulata]